LDALPQAAHDRIEPTLTRTSVQGEGRVIGAAGAYFDVVRFPVDAVFSIVATMENGDTLEVASVGCEGFVEADAALQSSFSRRESHCLLSGDVIEMPSQQFATEIDRSEAFGYMVRQSVSARLYATEQFSLCNLKHTIQERFARWLLMARDRVGAEDFLFTHETLALILGVRRAGVTVAVRELYEAGAIKQARGKINVRDSARLRSIACECYERTTQAFEDALLPRNTVGEQGGIAARATTQPRPS
jgi:Crp-like helix-turn-helix protein